MSAPELFSNPTRAVADFREFRLEFETDELRLIGRFWLRTDLEPSTD